MSERGSGSSQAFSACRLRRFARDQLQHSFIQTCRHLIDVDAFRQIEAAEQRPPIESRLLHASEQDREGIRMLGFRNQSELPRFYDLCDAFVLPSIHEPWGLVVNEAMNAGKAIVVSDQVGCQPDLVTDGDNGVVFPARDVGALADALANVLADQTACRKMGERSLQRIQAFSFEANVQGLMQACTAASEHK